MRDKENRTVTEEKKIIEQDVALREQSEVVELLEHEMEKFLVEKGITADRMMNAAIRTAIEDIIDNVGVCEDKTIVDLDYVKVDLDSVGGRVLYVFLTSEYTTHKIPVTRHLADIKDIGHIGKDEFVDKVKSALNDYNLSGDDLKQAVKECLTIMRKEKLIRK